jgi:hypothetical protein
MRPIRFFHRIREAVLLALCGPLKFNVKSIRFQIEKDLYIAVSLS